MPDKNYIRHHVTGILRLSIADNLKKILQLILVSTSLKYDTYGAWVCKQPHYNLDSKRGIKTTYMILMKASIKRYQ